MRLLFYHCRIIPSVESGLRQLSPLGFITQANNHASPGKTLLFSPVKDQVYTRSVMTMRVPGVLQVPYPAVRSPSLSHHRLTSVALGFQSPVRNTPRVVTDQSPDRSRLR